MARQRHSRQRKRCDRGQHHEDQDSDIGDENSRGKAQGPRPAEGDGDQVEPPARHCRRGGGDQGSRDQDRELGQEPARAKLGRSGSRQIGESAKHLVEVIHECHSHGA
jgi:hypothetical protein